MNATQTARTKAAVFINMEIDRMHSADFAAEKREAYQNGRAERVADLLKHGVDHGYYRLAMDTKTRTATISDSFSTMATAQGTLMASGEAGPITAESRLGAEWAAGFELYLDVRCAINRAIATRAGECELRSCPVCGADLDQGDAHCCHLCNEVALEFADNSPVDATGWDAGWGQTYD